MIHQVAKTIRLAIAMAILFGITITTLNAQQPGKGKVAPAPEVRAKRQTDQLKTELKLTPAQESKIYAIILKDAKKVDEAMKIKDPGLQHKTMAEIGKQKVAEINALLTPDKVKAYEKIREANKAKQQKGKH
ncbi:MAG: hypothetical protein WCK34_06290 [Bacteroidota bacterium]